MPLGVARLSTSECTLSADPSLFSSTTAQMLRRERVLTYTRFTSVVSVLNAIERALGTSRLKYSTWKGPGGRRMSASVHAPTQGNQATAQSAHNTRSFAMEGRQAAPKHKWASLQKGGGFSRRWKGSIAMYDATMDVSR